MRLMRGWAWLVAMVALVVSNSKEAHGKRSYIQRLPNVPADWPAVGHTNPNDDGPLNSFGKDFKAAGKKWTVDLCRKDSDGDGLTNGEELGDPDCVWSPGQTPQRTTGITHPAIPNAKPATTSPTVITKSPSLRPTSIPSNSPTTGNVPASMPSNPDVTGMPSTHPSELLTNYPTFRPTIQPTAEPTVPPTAEPTSQTSDDTVAPTTSATSQPAKEQSTGLIPPWLLAHVILGGLSVGFLVPMGNAVSSFGRRYTYEWKNLHVYAGVVALVFSFFALLLGLTGVRDPLESLHGKLGVAWLLFGMLQLFTGFARYWRVQCLRRVGKWHETKRFVLIPVSIALLWTGYGLLLSDDWFDSPVPMPLLQFAGIHVFVCIVFWGCHSWYHVSKWRKARARRSNNNEEGLGGPPEVELATGDFIRLQETSSFEPAIEASLILGGEKPEVSLNDREDSRGNDGLIHGIREPRDDLCNI